MCNKEVFLLSEGLKFCPIPNTIDLTNFKRGFLKIL